MIFFVETRVETNPCEKRMCSGSLVHQPSMYTEFSRLETESTHPLSSSHARPLQRRSRRNRMQIHRRGGTNTKNTAIQALCRYKILATNCHCMPLQKENTHPGQDMFQNHHCVLPFPQTSPLSHKLYNQKKDSRMGTIFSSINNISQQMDYCPAEHLPSTK